MFIYRVKNLDSNIIVKHVCFINIFSSFLFVLIFMIFKI